MIRGLLTTNSLPKQSTAHHVADTVGCLHVVLSLQVDGALDLVSTAPCTTGSLKSNSSQPSLSLNLHTLTCSSSCVRLLSHIIPTLSGKSGYLPGNAHTTRLHAPNPSLPPNPAEPTCPFSSLRQLVDASEDGTGLFACSYCTLSGCTLSCQSCKQPGLELPAGPSSLDLSSCDTLSTLSMSDGQLVCEAPPPPLLLVGDIQVTISHANENDNSTAERIPPSLSYAIVINQTETELGIQIKFELGDLAQEADLMNGDKVRGVMRRGWRWAVGGTLLCITAAVSSVGSLVGRTSKVPCTRQPDPWVMEASGNA